MQICLPPGFQTMKKASQFRKPKGFFSFRGRASMPRIETRSVFFRQLL